ncbi:DMT family transporter [Mycobacterium antarcticum]|uniref:DMT family transporter n=1 Tax=unclassified Mycolicibacterium TaxID=2636767 RepID=UPI0024E1201A|nr:MULTISPECIES: DMT family transporter [unclassified Mycolicibacterium]
MLGHGLVVLFALCSAVCMAIGIVVRQRATMDVPSDQSVSARMFATLLRRPIWWAGTAVAVAGYVFQALALVKGSLIVVQPLLVSALLFALPLSARLAGRRVSRREWLWAGLLTIALAMFVLLAHPGPPDRPATWLVATIVGVGCLLLIVGCFVVARRVEGSRRAVLFAVGVGVLFGVVAVVTKLVMHLLDERGALGLLATPAPYALIILGVVATLLQQSAFHAGALQTSVPAMLVLEPIVAVFLGAVVLGEELDVNTYELAALVVAAVAMTAATFSLGRGEGAYAAELDMEAARATV